MALCTKKLSPIGGGLLGLNIYDLMQTINEICKVSILGKPLHTLFLQFDMKCM